MTTHQILFRYNLFHLPWDLVEYMRTEAGKNWSALIISTVIFWGGTVMVFCIGNAFINKKDIDIHAVLLLPAIWAVFCIINVAAMSQYPGLFYTDPTIHTSRWFRTWLVALGPIGTLRMAALWFFLSTRISGRYYRTDMLASIPVSKWPEDNSWHRTVKRQMEVPVVMFRTKFKRALKFLWKIANIRIEII